MSTGLPLPLIADVEQQLIPVYSGTSADILRVRSPGEMGADIIVQAEQSP